MSNRQRVVTVVRRHAIRKLRHVKLDEARYTGPGADEKLVDSMAKLVVQCLKEDGTSIVCVRGWSGIGSSRVMDRVRASLPTSLNQTVREKDFCGCVRLEVKPYLVGSPEYEIRGKVEELLQMRLLGGNRKDDLSYWRMVAATFNWKPLVVIVENLQVKIDIDAIGIPSYVTDNEGVRYAFMKMAFTCTRETSIFPSANNYSELLAGVQNMAEVVEVNNEFADLPGEVAYQMVFYEANNAAESIKGERLQSLVKWKFIPLQESLTGMMLPSLAPDILRMNTNIENLTGETVIHILSYCILLPPFSSELIDYLRSDNVLLPYVGNGENSWDENILVLSLFHDLRARSLLEKGDRLPSCLKDMFVALASSSSSSSSSLSIIRQFQSYLVRHSEKIQQVDMSQWNKDLRKISFVKNQIKEVLLPTLSSASSANFSILSTLILRDSPKLEEIPDDVFRYMPNLRILDLSYCSVKTLPSSLSCLWNLRMLSLSNCMKLQTIRTIGLDNLEVLSLTGSPLARLEKAPWCHMRNLKHFIFRKGLCSLQELQLSLRNVQVFDEHNVTPNGLMFPTPEASCLQKFNISILHPTEEEDEEEIRRRRTRDVYFHSSRFPYEHTHALVDGHTTKSVAYPIVREGFTNPRDKCLEINGGKGLWSLYTLIGMFRPQLLSLHNYLNAQEGIWPTEELKDCYIKCCNDMEYAFNSPSSRNASWMEHLEGLERLWLSSNTKLAAICNDRFSQGMSFGLLKSIYLEYCPNLFVLFPVPVSLPQLQVMEVRFCSRLQNLFTAEHRTCADIVLPKLERLHLCQLPKLSSICDAGYLPSLQKLEVRGCLNLRTVPFPSSNNRNDQVASKVLVVRGEEEWWKNVQGFNKLDHVIDFKAGFDSAAPKRIPSKWKRGPRRPRPVIRGS